MCFFVWHFFPVFFLCVLCFGHQITLLSCPCDTAFCIWYFFLLSHFMYFLARVDFIFVKRTFEIIGRKNQKGNINKSNEMKLFVFTFGFIPFTLTGCAGNVWLRGIGSLSRFHLPTVCLLPCGWFLKSYLCTWSLKRLNIYSFIYFIYIYLY